MLLLCLFISLSLHFWFMFGDDRVTGHMGIDDISGDAVEGKL